MLYFISLLESIVYNIIVDTWYIFLLLRQWYGIILVGQFSGFGIRVNSLAPNARTSFFNCSKENDSQPIFPLKYIQIPSNNFGHCKLKLY